MGDGYPETIFEKLGCDSWANVVIMSDGHWFITAELLREYDREGDRWLEFCLISGHDIHGWLRLDMRKCLNHEGHLRRIAVKAKDISCVMELDS